MEFGSKAAAPPQGGPAHPYALIMAAKAGSRRQIIRLLPFCDPNLKDAQGLTALFHAVARRHWHCAAVLLDVSEDLSIQAQDGETMLRLCASAEEGEEAGLFAGALLERGGGGLANQPLWAAQIPLHGVAQRGRAWLVRRLGALCDIDARDWMDRTPLMHAAMCANQEAMEALLGLGADASLQDKEGRNALMFAAALRPGSQGCVEALLPRCDPGAADQYGRSAACLARGFGEEAIADLVAAFALSKREVAEIASALGSLPSRVEGQRRSRSV